MRHVQIDFKIEKEKLNRLFIALQKTYPDRSVGQAKIIFSLKIKHFQTKISAFTNWKQQNYLSKAFFSTSRSNITRNSKKETKKIGQEHCHFC